MTPDLHYIPLAHVEAEVAAVRRCLQKCGRQLQQQGEIPPDVSEAEINAEMEKYVDSIVNALHHSPLYHHIREEHPRQLERHIRQLIEKTVLAPGRSAPAVAADQISYWSPNTNQTLTPTWRHRKCGGTVYTSSRDFACSVCKKTGELGVLFPEEVKTQEERMHYLLTKVDEVDLT